MSFFSRLFSKSPSDLLAKGDRYMESDCYFDARTCYEDAAELCQDSAADGELKNLLSGRIDEANRKLAGRNIQEAESAHSRGETAKAVDHLELVKTLTYDTALREKAEKLLLTFTRQEAAPVAPVAPASCGSCTGSSCGDSAESAFQEDSLPQIEYYELLIQQLPAEEYQRYALLGEDFAYAYIAASRDLHHEALSGFDTCADATPQDIFRYEKGKVLHRLGDDREAELHFRAAIRLNGSNSLAWLALALLQSESGRLADARETAETMCAEGIAGEQALLLRAELLEATGDHESALNRYIELLQTPYARAAAERLHGLLLECGRDTDAAVIFKKYLNKSCH